MMLSWFEVMHTVCCTFDSPFNPLPLKKSFNDDVFLQFSTLMNSPFFFILLL